MLAQGCWGQGGGVGGRAAGLLPLRTFADLCTLPTSYESPPFTLGMAFEKLRTVGALRKFPHLCSKQRIVSSAQMFPAAP